MFQYMQSYIYNTQVNSSLEMKLLIQTLLQAGIPTATQKNFGILPYILTILANCLWPIAWLYCNENKISFAQSTLIRGICSIMFSYVACQYTPSLQILQYRNNFRLLLVRSIIMTLHSFSTGFMQFVLPLPIVHTIACSGTIFVFIIDYVMHGTTINFQQGVGIAIGLIGVFLASNGTLITQYFNPDYQYHTKYQNYLITDPFAVTILTLFYSVVVILWAYGIVLTRLAKSNTFQINFILGIVFYFAGCLILPFMPYLDYNLSSFSTLLQILLFTGLPCFIVQILVITSLTMTKQTGVLNIMGFSMVFVSYIISIFRYHEKPNFFSFCGIIMVIFGCGKTVLGVKKSDSLAIKSEIEYEYKDKSQAMRDKREEQK